MLQNIINYNVGKKEFSGKPMDNNNFLSTRA